MRQANQFLPLNKAGPVIYMTIFIHADAPRPLFFLLKCKNGEICVRKTTTRTAAVRAPFGYLSFVKGNKKEIAIVKYFLHTRPATFGIGPGTADIEIITGARSGRDAGSKS
jgi:hypothetical protein